MQENVDPVSLQSPTHQVPSRYHHQLPHLYHLHQYPPQIQLQPQSAPDVPCLCLFLESLRARASRRLLSTPISIAPAKVNICNIHIRRHATISMANAQRNISYLSRLVVIIYINGRLSRSYIYLSYTRSIVHQQASLLWPKLPGQADMSCWKIPLVCEQHKHDQYTGNNQSTSAR
ncbi:hypothetical protein L211DRAFT_143073 [Terfezia boudieri ATCC MYA-4762]|uniref:Uncharacterized protein n=1 Tax=Terfezia boudieri ATCC MYA-4762 TaxID=1051890 RepID=A0A3N4LVL9_9PEZI|nr:hypothetical protein L211DRAFT_143073 [Terfezia boudieri ATCC MYA-4762]